MPWCYTTDPLIRFEDCFEICSNQMGEKELALKLVEDFSTLKISEMTKTTTAMTTTMFSTTMIRTRMLKTAILSTTMLTTTTAKTTNISDAKKRKDVLERITSGISTTKSTSIFTTTAKSSYSTTNLISNSTNTIFPSPTLPTVTRMSEASITNDSKLTATSVPTSRITATVGSTSSPNDIKPSKVIPLTVTTSKITSKPIPVTDMPDFYTTKSAIEIEKLLEWQPITDKRDKSIATGSIFKVNLDRIQHFEYSSRRNIDRPNIDRFFKFGAY